MGFIVISILTDELGHTVGASIKNTLTNEVSNLSTEKLRGMYKQVYFENAILDVNGFVRAKRSAKPLKRVIFTNKRSAVQQSEISKTNKLLTSNKLLLYHGSKESNLIPKYGYGSKNNDYGRGFYMTPDRELGKEWAWSGYTSGDSAFVYSYNLDLTGLSVLNLTELDSIHWVTELIYNRRLNLGEGLDNEVAVDNIKKLISRYKINTTGYDVIIGYRADDSYFQYATSFVKGLIYKGTLDTALRFGELGIQVFIKSKSAFEALSQVSVELVPRLYKQRYDKRDKYAREQYISVRKNQTTQDRRTIYDFLK